MTTKTDLDAYNDRMREFAWEVMKAEQDAAAKRSYERETAQAYRLIEDMEGTPAAAAYIHRCIVLTNQVISAFLDGDRGVQNSIYVPPTHTETIRRWGGLRKQTREVYDRTMRWREFSVGVCSMDAPGTGGYTLRSGRYFNHVPAVIVPGLSISARAQWLLDGVGGHLGRTGFPLHSQRSAGYDREGFKRYMLGR